VEAFDAALDVRALPGQKLIDAVVDFLAARSLPLVVDSCEHLRTAISGLADGLLRSAPQLDEQRHLPPPGPCTPHPGCGGDESAHAHVAQTRSG
jgi:hypothetical protein